MDRKGKETAKNWGFFLILGVFCLANPLAGGKPGTPQISVEDLGRESGFQDSWDNQYRKGRSIVAEDFNGDGWVDFFVGNPGNESVIFRNLGPGPGGVARFTPDQVLLQGELAFTASGADYDNDSDLDLFIGCGGQEGVCLDYLFRNDSTPGQILFTDVSNQAGIRGPAPGGFPLPHATTGGAWGDYDRDGDQDLFVSVMNVDHAEISYKSILWRNNGDGTFSDVTISANLDYWEYDTRTGPSLVDWGHFQNSTWIDADNDGDLDLLLNNANGPNVLWKNLLTEQGIPQFVDATQAFSLPGEDLSFPHFSFASAVADFNNDGWQDLMFFAVQSEPSSSPYGNGNGLFINQNGQGFFNAASQAGINMEGGGAEVAMGCQVADLNADGIPDLAIGAGQVGLGTINRLLLSRMVSNGIPIFDDTSALLDFEPLHGIDPALPPYPEIPPYPYRTHGMAAADIDGDGILELGMVNGGPAVGPDIVREPNRLFRFSGPGLGSTFRVRLRGNGLTDSRDAIGTRAYVEIPSAAGVRRIFQTVLSGSGFSAQNELTLTFGLKNDTAITRLAVMWNSGCIQILDNPGPGTPSPLVMDETCWTCPGAPGPVEAWLNPDAYGCGPCLSDPDCEDGIFCNGAESCDSTTGQCLPGPPPTCDDGNLCTADHCDPGQDACVHLPPALPVEVTNLRQELPDPDSGSSTLTWDADPLAGAYHFYHAHQPGLSDLTCHMSGVLETTTLCDDLLAPGEICFHLVTAINCSGESTLGSDSAGSERSNLAPCP